MHRPDYIQGGQEVGRGYLLLGIQVRRIQSETEAVFLKLLWSPGINSKELIPPAYALAGQSPYL